MKKTAFILMIITIASQIIGFGRDIILTYFYGASSVTDAYLISTTIVSVLFFFIIVGISTSYVPVYQSIENNLGEKKSIEFTNNIVNILLILSTIIIMIGLIFTDGIVSILVSNNNKETFQLAVILTKINFFSIYFIGLVHIFSTYLRMKNMFLIPAMVGFPLNIIVAMSIYFSFEIDIKILAYGSVLAVFVQFLFLAPFVIKAGFKYTLKVNLKDENIKKMLLMALPIMIGASIHELNIIIDRSLASRIVEGGISALNYANRLNGFVQAIFITSIATVVYPTLSKLISVDNKHTFIKMLRRSLVGVSLLVIPSSLGLIILSEPIIKLLFERGAFDNEAVLMTSDALLFYSIGLIGYGFREIISRAFYAMQDSVTPVINGGIAVITNIILNFVLSKYMGIGGLALATSISGLLSSTLLMISLNRKIGNYGLKDILKVIFKILIATIVMGIFVKFSIYFFEFKVNNVLNLLIALILGFLSYSFAIYLMKVEEVVLILSQFKRKLRKN